MWGSIKSPHSLGIHFPLVPLGDITHMFEEKEDEEDKEQLAPDATPRQKRLAEDRKFHRKTNEFFCLDAHYEASTPFQKLNAEIRLVVFKLLTSTQTLQDNAIVEGLEILSLRTLTAFGIFKRALFVAALGFFFALNFIQLFYWKTFITLNPAAGHCMAIAKPWTIKNLAGDYNGKWRGQSGYEATQSIYTFNLYNFRNIIEVYQSWMKSIDMTVKDLGQRWSAERLFMWSLPEPPYPPRRRQESATSDDSRELCDRRCVHNHLE